jgi:hypothetical protein
MLRPIWGALLVIGLSIGSSAGQPAAPSYQGPIKTLAQCPFASPDRVSVAALPKARLQAYFSCVARHNPDAAMAQAASWIEDWYQAAACVYYCDAEGIHSISHVSLWRGLRYIIAQSLPSDQTVDESCRRAQLNVATALDEGMNDLVGYRRHILETSFCATRKSQDQIEQSRKRVEEYWSRFYGQMETFERARR